MEQPPFYILANYPLEVLLRKGLKKPFQLLRKGKEKRRLYASDLRKDEKEHSLPGSLNSFLNTEFFPSSLEDEREKASSHLLHRYLEHRFDLLGSGWMKWGCKDEARGFEGYHYGQEFEGVTEPWAQLHETHQHKAREILRSIDDPSYEAIDWQRDLRSGFRWDISRTYAEQMSLSADSPGADPKVPMELGRLQHLPRMAVLTAASKEGGAEYVREFRSQVLDFIAMNPPGMGIQWASTMEAGIRVVNLLVAYDLFSQLDEEGALDDGFKTIFFDSVQLHARFILEHLEYQEGLTGNHYLFNIAGILFCGAYLPSTPFSDRLLAFALPELIRELFKQFFAIGGNFEGSTAYHLLSSEMFFYCSALVLGSTERLQAIGWKERISLSKRSHGISGSLHSTAEAPLPEPYLQRLERVLRTCEALKKPNGEHPQIGDNDSGRLFRITPMGDFRSGEELERLYQERPASSFERAEQVFDENLLDMQGVLSAGRVLFGSLERTEPFFEGEMIRSLLGDHPPLTRSTGEISLSLSENRTGSREDPQAYQDENRILFDRKLNLSQGEWWIDPDAGFIVFRTPALHLTINAPLGEGLRHTWGHVHNDRLGLELHVEGKDLLIDPGSYVYGALPEERNAFRSVGAHNVPIVEGREQNVWPAGKEGVFFMKQSSKCHIIAFDPEKQFIDLEMSFQGVRHRRAIQVEETGLRIFDRCERSFRVNFNKGERHSRGYGKKLQPRSIGKER